MSKRSGRTRGKAIGRATALVPLALLSAAWTASIAGVGSPIAAASARPTPTLPDGTTVPTKAIQAPASVTTGTDLGLGVGDADAQQIVATADAAGIPSAALAAYQRAETVINAADKSCNLTWQLIAAIGRVESNHGRADGNVLNDNGIDTPGIYGVALNGQNGTTQIADTDAGQYDNDTQFDRAVGPMQFIPSTWSVVGVDADGDGVRNPQDINDAALATAVYLCSGSDDLSTSNGERAAVYRYNHSQSYVDLVLAIANAYTAGDFTTIPNGTVMAGELAPEAPLTHVPTGSGKPGKQINEPTTQPTGGPTGTPSSSPSSTPTSTPSGGSGGSGGGGGGGGVNIPGTPVSAPPLPSTGVTPVDQALTLVQATAQCVADGISQVLNPAAFQTCVDNYMHPAPASPASPTTSSTSHTTHSSHHHSSHHHSHRVAERTGQVS